MFIREHIYFVDRIFNTENMAKISYSEGRSFLPLMRYMYAQDAPYATGYYPMALKRREEA